MKSAKDYRPLTIEDKQIRIEIIEYLLSHKDELSAYSNRTFDKLQCKLKEYMGEI